MKKYIYSIGLLILPTILSAQVVAVNQGLTMRVGDGLVLKCQEGSLTNTNGTIENNGTIIIGGDFTQNTGGVYTGGVSGILEFNGGVSQNLNSDAPLNISSLRVDNGSQLVLGNELNIDSLLDLSTTNANVFLGTNDLTVGEGATISGYSVNSYVHTNSTGSLVIKASGGGNLYLGPVGDMSYTPVSFFDSGQGGSTLVIGRIDGVYNNGTTGSPFTGDVVGSWVIDIIPGPIKSTPNLTITVHWDSLDELPGFDRANCGVAYYDTCCAWNPPQSYSTATLDTTTNLWTQTITNVTSSRVLAVMDMDAFLVIDNPMDKNNFDVSIFPNPISDFINIQIGDVDTEQLGIRIYAANGQLVYQEGFDVSGNETLQLEAAKELAVGTYMVHLLLDDGTYMTKKIIKLRD